MIEYRTQTHVIKRNHRLYRYCDDMCFKSKNLYNRANFLIRESFINDKKIIFSNELNKILKSEECFKALPAKTSQQIVIQLGHVWKSFFKGIENWKGDRSSHTGMPRLPKYKDKNGRNIVFFDYMQGSFWESRYYFPVRFGEEYENYIETNVTKDNFVQMRIVPYGNCYKIEIVCEIEVQEKEFYNDSWIGIDLGIDNLATLTNNIGLPPIVINGRILKSINQYYNKIRSKALSSITRGTSNRIKRIDLKRNNIFNTHIHRISRAIVNYCINNKIDNIAIGKNKDWQRNVNLGRKNNQVFSQIPFDKLLDKIEYKARENGIQVFRISEEYTSKASFLDGDEFKKDSFSGRRIRRGLYKSQNGTIINADVNGSYNILRKCNPEILWYDWIEGVSLHPIRINI